MRVSVSIVAVICGTVLLVIPYLDNLITSIVISRTVVALDRDFNLTSLLPEWYRGAGFLVGLLMIITGLTGSVVSTRRPDQPQL